MFSDCFYKLNPKMNFNLVRNEKFKAFFSKKAMIGNLTSIRRSGLYKKLVRKYIHNNAKNFLFLTKTEGVLTSRLNRYMYFLSVLMNLSLFEDVINVTLNFQLSFHLGIQCFIFSLLKRLFLKQNLCPDA